MKIGIITDMYCTAKTRFAADLFLLAIALRSPVNELRSPSYR